MMDPNEALIESWMLSLHTKRPKTIAAYATEVRRFAAAHGDLVEVSKTDVLRWINDMQTRDLQPATIRARWIALRSFYGWAFDEEEIVPNPIAKVIVPKGDGKAPAPLTSGQVDALLKACAGADFYARRDLAIIRLFLSTGLRASELMSIEVGSLDLANRIAALEGKGGKRRVVRFDPTTAAAIDRYRRIRARHKAANLPNLWVGKSGPYTVKGLPQMITRRATAAGIGHVHPHQLRHTFADRWLAAGGTEGDLMQLGGWESPEMMRLYGRTRAVDRALGAYDTVDPMKGT